MAANRLYTLLALTGATPFLACALLLLLGFTSLPPFGAVDTLAGSYGLAILCFLCGAQWGTYLLKPGETPFNLFLSSNAVFLVVWFAFVLASTDAALIVQAAAFLFLLFVDHRIGLRQLYSRHYLTVRTIATSLAVASLLIIVFANEG